MIADVISLCLTLVIWLPLDGASYGYSNESLI